MLTLLETHCVSCHGGEKTKAGLDLVTRDALMRGGESGAAIVPGQPPASLLRLVFAGVESDKPLLSDLVRRFGLDLNIVHGQIDEVQGHPFGTLAVLASGARDQLTAAVGHLRGAGVQVQEVACA